MKFDCTPREFVELISNPLAAQLLAPLLEKVNTMSQSMTDLQNSVANLETAFAAEQAQSAGLRTTVGQLVTVANDLKAALNAALAGNTDAAAAQALIARVDALTTQAQADAAADTAANQSVSDAVTVNAPAA